jgi:hypothetical protein
VAAVEIAQIGRRHNLLHEFRRRRQHNIVISPPHDERLRLPILQIGCPLREVLDVRREAVLGYSPLKSTPRALGLAAGAGESG